MRTEAAAPRAAAPSGGIAFWGLMAVVALAPLPLGANRPWAWDLLAVFVAALLVAWSVAAFADTAIAPIGWRRHAFVSVPFFAVIAWAVFQGTSLSPPSWHHPLWDAAARALETPLAGAIALDPEAASEGAIRLGTYGCVFWLAMQLGRDARRARQAAWVIVVSGLAYAVYGLAIQLGVEITVLGEPKVAYRWDLTSTFINRNAYAVQAGLALLAVLALLGEATRPSGGYKLVTRTGLVRFLDSLPPAAYFLAAAALTLATALVLTHSRGGLAAMVGAVAAMIGASTLRQRESGLRRGVGLGLGALVAGIAVLSISGGLLLARIEQGLGGPGARDTIHALVRRAIADAPWTGTGLGSFPSLFRIYRGDEFPWTTPPFVHAHSIYLERAAELGIPAAIVLLGVAATIGGICLLGAIRRRRARIFPCLGLAATVLVALQGVYDFAVDIPAVAITWLVLAGIGYAQSFGTAAAPRS